MSQSDPEAIRGIRALPGPRPISDPNYCGREGGGKLARPGYFDFHKLETTRKTSQINGFALEEQRTFFSFKAVASSDKYKWQGQHLMHGKMTKDQVDALEGWLGEI